MREPDRQPPSDPNLGRIADELRWFRVLFTIIVVCVVNVSLGLTLEPQTGAYATPATLSGAVSVGLCLVLDVADQKRIGTGTRGPFPSGAAERSNGNHVKAGHASNDRNW